MIYVKVTELPGKVVEISLESGATVSQALAAAEMSAGSGKAITVNSVRADGETVLADGDKIVIAAGAKGNA